MEIIKNVEIPGKRLKYPWGQMDVGDAFFVPKSSRQASPALYASAKSFGVKIRIESRVHEGEPGVMVWRIE